MVPVTGVTNLISLTIILSESVKWMWSLYPCSVPSTMNMLVHVYDVVYYHKQGDNGSLCVYTNLSILFWLCRFVIKLINVFPESMNSNVYRLQYDRLLREKSIPYSYQPIASICMLLMLLSRLENIIMIWV